MIHIAVRIRELVSSNVDTMLDKADNPEKMLRLLRAEIEESLILLSGDLSRARRRQERLAGDAERVAQEAEEWTTKARTAMDHKREDLARAALLTREGERKRAGQLKADAQDASAEADEIEQAVAKLEAKRSDVMQRLAALPDAKPGAQADAGAARADTKTERRLDRIDELEKRIAFGMDGQDATPSPASVDAEIAALQREAEIDAELAGMKGAKARKPSRAKAK